jgi:phage FluMu gp28-like protein
LGRAGGEFIKKSILLPYQQRWVNDKSPLKIWLAARQIGKSFAISMEAVIEALSARCTNLILSCSERQSKEVMEKVYSHLRYLKVRSFEEISPESETKEEVRLPNGSRIISLPANPDTVRGFSGNIFLDEFAFHRDAATIWRAMYPAVTRGYRVRITSTPNGRSNLFHDLWHQNDGFSRHKTDIYEAIGEGLMCDIKELRRGIFDADAWAQEYECRFVDETTAYITYEMIAACEDEGASKEFYIPTRPPFSVIPASEARRESFPEKDSRPGESPEETGQAGMTKKKDVGAGLALPEKRAHQGAPLHVSGAWGEAPQDKMGGWAGDFYLGVDIGRKHDLTVLWLWEKVGDVFWTKMVREMRNAPFSLQRDFLYSLLDGSFFVGAGLKPAPTIRRCCIDSSGLGAQLSEEAREKFGRRVEQVTFTSTVKEDLAVTAKRMFEEKKARIPVDREIREDIHSVRRSTTVSGHGRFDADRNEHGHADRFWALALGLHAAIGSDSWKVEYASTGRRTFAGIKGYF